LIREQKPGLSQAYGSIYKGLTTIIIKEEIREDKTNDKRA